MSTFHIFLNSTNGTKSRNASHMWIICILAFIPSHHVIEAFENLNGTIRNN